MTLTNVDEVPLIHHLFEQQTAGCVGVITVSPVNTEAESLIPPGEEADTLHDGGLHDLLAGEDTPGHSVRTIAGRVGVEVTIFGHSIVCEVGVVLEATDHLGEDAGMDQKLEVRLLVDVTIRRAPAVDRVCRLDAIDGRLRVDGQKAALVKVLEI